METYTSQTLPKNFTGTCIYVTTTGSLGTYTGQFLNGRRTGKGEYRWNNGNVYIGDFINGHMTGKGEMLYKDGSKYIGEWINNKWFGNGEYYFPPGHPEEVSHHGIFSDGAFQSGFMIDVNGKRRSIRNY